MKALSPPRGRLLRLPRFIPSAPYTRQVNADKDFHRGTARVNAGLSAPVRLSASTNGKHEKREPSREASSRNVVTRRIFWALAILSLVILFMWTVVPHALQWKSGQKWEDFLQDFVTSPAAAGCAAVLAAVIASVTFNMGLKHSKEEAQATRRKEAAEAWWEQFEWVTDRIIPKDSEQARIAKPLAADLLVSLDKMAAEDFQREAILGVINHYVLKTEDDAPLRSPDRDVNAEARSFRNLAESTNSTAASSAALAAEYEQAGLRALSDAWEETKEVQILPTIALHQGRVIRPDAILNLKGHRIVVDFKAWNKFRPTSVDRTTDHFELAISQNILTDILVVSMAELPEDFSHARNNIHVIHWSISEGAENLTSRISTLVETLPACL